jgi:hypothetical protein
MRASRDLSQNDESSLPTSKQHSMPSARESSPMGSCPRRSSTSSLSQSRTSPNARTASRGIPRRHCGTVQPQRSSWKQFGSPPRCGLGAPTIIRPLCDLYPISARQFETDPYRLPPKVVGVFFGGFVSGISSQTIKTVLRATPAMLPNPTAPPKVPTTRLWC